MRGNALNAFCPVTGFALGVSYRDDLDFPRKLAEDDREGVVIEDGPPCPMKVLGKETGLPMRPFDGEE